MKSSRKSNLADFSNADTSIWDTNMVNISFNIQLQMKEEDSRASFKDYSLSEHKLDLERIPEHILIIVKKSSNPSLIPI